MLDARLDDFDDLARLFASWGGEFLQMSRGAFQGRIRVLGGARIRLFQVQVNQALLTRGVDATDYVTCIPITPRNERTLWHDRRLRRGQLLVKPPSVPYENQVQRDTAFQTLLASRTAVLEAGRALSGHAAEPGIDVWAGHTPPPPVMRRLTQFMGQVLAASPRSPSLLGGPGGEETEDQCLRLLVDALLAPEVVPPARLRIHARAALVRRAQALMQDALHAGQALRAQDLCTAVGASDRILRRAFHETFGVGPIAYLRLLRMHAAREALKAARGGAAGVTQIAAAYGFHRAGAFAVEYRRQFGEAPSATLGVRGCRGVQSMVRAGLLG
jgi:AraC family ethanolamine operon transcriptional activator